MIKPKRNDVAGLFPISGSLVHNTEGRCTLIGYR